MERRRYVGSALTGDGTTGYGTTSGPVVRTDASFSVAAWVRLPNTDDGSLPAHVCTVLSQAGVHQTGFQLYYSYTMWIFNKYVSGHR
jgi:hypothetical protein